MSVGLGFYSPSGWISLPLSLLGPGLGSTLVTEEPVKLVGLCVLGILFGKEVEPEADISGVGLGWMAEQWKVEKRWVLGLLL